MQNTEMRQIIKFPALRMNYVKKQKIINIFYFVNILYICTLQKGQDTLTLYSK